MSLSNKQQLKELETKKGLFSRQIKDKKEKNQPYEQLMEQTRSVSIEIKRLRAKIKSTKKQANKNNLQITKEAPPPSQFKDRVYDDKGATPLSTAMNTSPEEWDRFVKNHPNATAYHTYAIRNTVEDTFGHDCHYISAIDSDGNIQGVLPLVSLKSYLFEHYLISVPFFNYGGILANSMTAEQLLKTKAIDTVKLIGANHVELRHCYEDKEMPTRSDKVTMLLHLPETAAELWKNLGSKLRAQINKAKHSEATVRTGREELLDDFYKVFSKNMRDLGTPVYSKNFFKNMLKYNKTAAITIVYLNSKPVSSGFTLGWRETLEIPWASTLKSANKYNANMLLYWTILEYSINSSYKIFDFGRSNKDSTTYKFKKQWGAEAAPLFWHYWLKNGEAVPQINPKKPKYQLVITMWKTLPVWLTQLLGPFIVKSLP